MTKQAMTEYEIRILGSDGRPSLFSEWIHVSLNAAIRSAKRMANGATFEIWIDGARIYTSQHATSHVFGKHNPKAA
jgi:hypothetical protein